MKNYSLLMGTGSGTGPALAVYQPSVLPGTGMRGMSSGERTGINCSLLTVNYFKEIENEEKSVIRTVCGDGGPIVDYTGTGKDVDIPSSIDGQEITIIGAGAFYNKGFTSVTIPDTVGTIGAYAFGENQLTSVTIPDSVSTIGYHAFAGNPLTRVTLGTGAFPGNLVDVYNSGGRVAGTWIGVGWNRIGCAV
jgi:hypothetical protein